MTFSIGDARHAAQRTRMQRLRAMQRARYEALRRAAPVDRVFPESVVRPITMHVTPWWKDEFGNMTRQVWAK